MGKTHHFVPEVEHKESHLESRHCSKHKSQITQTHTHLVINLIFPKYNNSNIYRTALDGFSTHQGIVQNTFGTTESQIRQNNPLLIRTPPSGSVY